MLRWLRGIGVALRSLILRRRVEDELEREMQYHLEREIEQYVAAGLTPEEARYTALRAMGAMAVSKEEIRDVRNMNTAADFFADLRYAARALRRSPGFALLAIFVMALGIGANTAVFSIVNAVLLKPLPYAGADRIVRLSTSAVTGEGRDVFPLVSMANFRDWRDQSSSFEGMSTYRGGEYPLTTAEAAEYGRGATVDAQFFQVFAVQPVLGRTFTAEEMPESRVVLISHEYWKNHFGGDAAVLERTIRVGNDSFSIIGVMPPGFEFPSRSAFWFPQTTRTTSRTGHNFFAVGRLKPGVSMEQAQAELNGIAERLEQQYPDSNKGRGAVAIGLQDDMVGNVRLTLYLLWGVVAVVLLIACANTATLLLGKATARVREVGLRAALGASRRRIIRQLITESLLLAVLSGIAGVLLAYWGSQLLVGLAPSDVIRLAQTGIDGGVLAFTLAVSLGTSILFGVIPALHASKIDLIDALRLSGTRSVMGGRTVRARSILVVAEIALSVVLLTGAGLLMKSLLALHHVDLGFEPENVLVMRATGIAARPQNNAYFQNVLSRIAASPGVVAVGATSIPPGDMSLAGSGAYFIDRMPEHRDRTTDITALDTIVAPGTFAALGIPLRRGRDFDDGDTADRPPVAIVNEALVRRSFGTQDPIGRTIFCPFDRPDGMTIVGVVGDVRTNNPSVEPIPECYMPYLQHAYNRNTLHVVARASTDPTSLTSTLRRISAESARDVPVSFTTMNELLSNNVAEPRFRALLLGTFAALAVCLAMAGVYGVMAYAVQQRSNEIGLRMALGASRTSVLRLILTQAMILAAGGLAVGLSISLASTRLLGKMLFQVEPMDAVVYAGAIALVAAVTLVAGFMPARRAAIMDPMTVLKSD